MAICLLGADPDRGDLGVDALVHAVALGVTRAGSAEGLVVVGGRGGRRARAVPAGDTDLDVTLAGASPGGAPWRADSLRRLGWAARAGGALSATARDLLLAPVVLDAAQLALPGPPTPAQLHTLTALRQLALRAGRPLVLLPQPHGPFGDDPALRRAACQAVAGATAVWASDDAAARAVADLLAAAAGAGDTEVHRGVDPRFALVPREPARHVRDVVLTLRADAGRVVGVQVDGRAWAAGSGSDATPSERAYRRTVAALVDRLLAEEKTHVLLVPQVLGATGRLDADTQAHADLHESLPPAQAARVSVLPVGVDATETAWSIAQTEWFAGSTEWSLLAAVATQTPAAALTNGAAVRSVMAAAGLEQEVPPSGRAPDELAEQLATRAGDRDVVARSLADAVPALRRRAEQEMALALSAR